MKLQLSGFETPVYISPDKVSMLVIENRILYSRVVTSLLSEMGEFATEPYILVSDDDEILKPSSALMIIDSPFTLPWDHKELGGALYSVFEARLLEDDMFRIKLEEAANAFQDMISSFGLSLQSDYTFSSSWDIKRYLKAFGYKIDKVDLSLLDSLIVLFTLMADVNFKKPVVFINLQLFLSENQLQTLIDQAIFYGIQVLLLENVSCAYECVNLQKQYIDQDFLEA